MEALPVLQREAISDAELHNWPLRHLKEILIEMGKQCNVRCVMCYQTDFSPATRTAEIIWKERLLPAFPTADRLLISGGEPTILPGARELLKTVTTDYQHLKLHTVTNGVLFRGIWEEAFLAQGGSVNVSINAVDPDLYAKVVQFGRLQDVVTNIERLISRKNAMGSSLRIRISSVILDETIHEMADFIQWGADHGLDEVLFYTDYLRGIRKHSTQEVRSYLAQAYKAIDRNPQLTVYLLEEFDRTYATQNGLKPVRIKTESQRPTKPCNLGFDSIAINPDGTTHPCCKSWYSYGNLIESDLLSVWNSDAAYKFRKRMLNMDFRDCEVACDLNAKPINKKIADGRKAYAIIKRNPKSAVKKGLRKLGLSNAQIDMPEEMKPKALTQLGAAKKAEAISK